MRRRTLNLKCEPAGRKENKAFLCFSLLLGSSLFFAFAVLADFNLKEWAKWREIIFQPDTKKTDASGFVKIELDAAVCDGAQNDLRDLRVIDGQGREIASQITTGAPAFTSGNKPRPMPSLAASFRPWTKKRSDPRELQQHPTDWLIDLGAKNVPCERLEFVTEAVNFKRSILVQGSNDEREEKNWSDVGRAELFDIRVGRTRKQQLSFVCPPAKFRYLCVTIFNLDDPPITFTEIRAAGWPQQLLFRREAGRDYRLFYGNARANAPRYDLEHITAYLKPGQLMTASLSPEKINAEYALPAAVEQTKSPQPSVWLWLTIALAMLILLGLIYRLARLNSDGSKTQ